MLVSKIEACRLCRGRDLIEIFDLGDQALQGRFPGADEPDVPTAPLLLVKCSDCGLAQLGHDFDPDELYRHGYGYRSGINATMTNHLAGIATQVAQRAGLRSGDTVLDIASNDGTLLRSYEIDGLRRIGIDPTIAQYGSYYPADIATVADFFTADNFVSVSPNAKARGITSISMFYDLPDPNAFVADVASALAGDGLWVLEQSDLSMMIDARSFDTICHEHLEYYALRQIESLCAAHGLRVFDVETNDTNGGSARIFVCHIDGPYAAHDANLAAAREREQRHRLDDLDTFVRFRQDAQGVRDKLVATLKREKAAGRTIHIYGASTKGNVLLQYCGINAGLIDAAADRNPRKWGCRTPGTNIPIISEEESRAAKPDFFLVLPWHFRDEFVERETEFVAAGGKLIFPLPRFEIYPAS